MSSDAPRYVHDGPRDIFLGRHGAYDLYFRPGLGGGSVHARWSDSFWDCLHDRAHQHDALDTARRIAKDRGLILGL